MIHTSSLRPGMIFEDGDKYLVLTFSHMKKGRGQATNRVKVRNLETGSITEMTYSNEQSVNEADVKKQNAQFLYADDKFGYFMDSEDFSQFEINLKDLEWELNFLKEGTKVITLYIDSKAVSIQLPNVVELEVSYTEPASAGNTANGALKDAKFETGFVTKVPLFIKVGDIISINTEDGAYRTRVN